MPRCPTCHRRLIAGAACPSDRGVAVGATDHVLMSPPHLAGYTCGNTLGSGGYGTVFAATQTSEQDACALKVGRSTTERARQRFQREAEALKAIGPPLGPRFIDSGQLSDGAPYLVMERLEGVSLADELAAAPEQLPLERVAHLCELVLDALCRLHAAGWVHGDLTPDNVVVVGDKLVRLIDFGLACPVPVARGEHVVGTPEYMAPELFRPGAARGVASDVYAFGIIAYELFTLRPPFVGDRGRVEYGHQALLPAAPRTAELPRGASELVLACLSKRIDQRPDLAWVKSHWRGALKVVASAQRPLGSAPTSCEPVALIGVRVEASAPSVVQIAAQNGGVLVRHEREYYVIAFTPQTCEDPAAAAIASARAFCDEFNAATCAHVSVLQQQTAGNWYGLDLVDPSRWLPEASWSGACATSAFAAAFPHRVSQSVVSYPRFFELASEAPDSHPVTVSVLQGRNDVLSQLKAAVRDCVARRSPRLVTVTGVVGIGKSRVARELFHMAEALRADCVFLSGRSGSEREFDGRFSTGLAGLGLSAEQSVRDLGDGLRAVAQARAGGVVVVLDDAHCADATLLDALEYATLDGYEMPLLVAVFADSSFSVRRDGWGDRARDHVEIELGALSPDDSIRLAEELLQPVTYPPMAAVEQLVGWTAGNPLALTQVVGMLKRSGLIRRRPNGDSYYLATADLQQLPRSPVWQWLASRTTDELPPELAVFAQVCAVLGDGFTSDELACTRKSVYYELEGLQIDADVGLRELVVRNIIVSSRHGYDFVSAAVRDGLAAGLSDRGRVGIHRGASAFWQQQLGSGTESEALGRFARHAAGAGLVREAAHAHLQLAESVLARYRAFEADTHATAAIACMDSGEADHKQRALQVRACARNRMARTTEALADLQAACDLAAERGDQRAVAMLQLDRATVLDWMDDFDAAASAVQRARSLDPSVCDPTFLARLEMARGRELWRSQDPATAVEVLRRAVVLAKEASDLETEIISLLLLGPALVVMGHVDQAATVFDEVIERCQGCGDRLHLAAALGNRMFLWSAMRDAGQAQSDLEELVMLARELGHPRLERVGTYNLAELQYWLGRDAEALRLVERSQFLCDRFGPHGSPHEWMLLSRIYIAIGDHVRSQECRASVVQEAQDKDSTIGILHRMVGMVIDDAPDDRWEPLVVLAHEELPEDEYLEIAYWRLRCAISTTTRAQARSLYESYSDVVARWPVWDARFAVLRHQLM